MAKGGGGSRGGSRGGGGGGGGGGSSAEPSARSAEGQRTSVEERFGTRARAVERFQRVLRNPNSTPEEREAAKRIIASNAALAGLTGERARRDFLIRAGFG